MIDALLTTATSLNPTHPVGQIKACFFNPRMFDVVYYLVAFKQGKVLNKPFELLANIARPVEIQAIKKPR